MGGSTQLAQGGSVTIVSSGYMVTLAKQAVRELEKAGLKCNLFDAYCLPLNAEPILAAAKNANGVILTVEDNFGGGFNGAVAEAAAQTGEVKVFSMTAPRIPKSGKSGDLVLASLGLGVQDIVTRAKGLA